MGVQATEERQAPEASLVRAAVERRGGVAFEEVEALEQEDSLEAVQLAMRGGLNLLRQEPWLVGWSVLGEGLAGVIKLAPIVIVLTALLLRVVVLADSGPLELLRGLWGWGTSAEVLIGIGGLWGVTWVLAWALEVLVASGVWGALWRRLQAGRTIIARGVFWKCLGERFGLLMGWSLLRGLSEGAALLLAVGLVWAGLEAAQWSGAAGALPAGGARELALAAWLGVLLALGVGVYGLVVLLYRMALPYVVIQGQGVFEALAGGARLMAGRLGEALWLQGAAAGLFVVVLAVYLPFAALAGWMSGEPSLALVGGVMRMGLDLAYAIGLAVASVWAWGAGMTWTALREGWISGVPGVAAPAVEGPSPSWLPMRGRAVTPAVEVAEGEAASLLPAATPAVVGFDEVRRRLAGQLTPAPPGEEGADEADEGSADEP